MTGEEGTEGKVNEVPGKFRQNTYVLIDTSSPDFLIKIIIRKSGPRIFLDKPKQK
jgi:hypothetical protein